MLKLDAHAKINLTLAICGRRPDGYHILDTVFQPVTLADTLLLERLPDGELRFSCSDRELEGEDNLVCRAWQALRSRCGLTGGLDIRLEKRLPAQAGLGGGSADAAALLKGANALYELGLSRRELAALGGTLGADVAALVYEGAMRGRGTGTDLSPIPTRLTLPLVIVKPAVSCSTPAMYRLFDEAGRAGVNRCDEVEQALRQEDAAAVCRCLSNDFESVAREPEILAARAALLSSGAQGALLSGSGSAVFGIYESAAVRDRALAELLAAGHRAWACETLNREENT